MTMTEERTLWGLWSWPPLRFLLFRREWGMLEADPDSLVLLAVVFLAVAALRIWLVHV
jgi:hypothetical protein